MTAPIESVWTLPVAEDRASAPSAKRSFLSWMNIVVYFAIQAGSLLVFFVDFEVRYLALCAATFYIRLWAITGAYHRYFSHRTYRTHRVMQFALGLLGTTALQKGPLWWAAVHRNHHQHTDGSGDPHSPRSGFYHAHQGWIMGADWEKTRPEHVRDLARYPELRWLDRWHMIGPLLTVALCYAIAGWGGVIWGFLLSTTLCWHATYSVNSLAHRIGRRRYKTNDDSRNSLFVALLTLGEGWHNNHHFHPSCTRQGFFWWEIDITYYVLRAMQGVGLIWGIKKPPARAYARKTSGSKPEKKIAVAGALGRGHPDARGAQLSNDG